MSNATLKKLPNYLTLARLVLAVPFFCLLSFPGKAHALDAALALFVLAGLTDAFDGLVARRYGGHTLLGRVLDPAADKILVCGSFVFFVGFEGGAAVPAWMVVVVLARELTVNALRGVAESLGHSYPGSAWGKAKMATESVTIGYILVYAGHLMEYDWAEAVFQALLWLMLATVVVSGLQHVVRSTRLILSHEKPDPT